MGSLSDNYGPDRQADVPLFGLDPDTEMMGEDDEYASLSSGRTSPILLASGQQLPAQPRALKLELGPIHPQAQSVSQTEIDRKIKEAEKDLKQKHRAYREQKRTCRKVVDEIDSLAWQYNEEKQKAPVHPPKGTWFQQERKLFPQKKAGHDEKLRFILRLRQAMVDNDLVAANELLAMAANAVIEARTKLEQLHNEKVTKRA